MDELLWSRPVFLVVLVGLSLIYVLLKLRLATRRDRAAAPRDGAHWIKILEKSQDPAELWPALEYAGRSRDRRAVEALGRLLGHPDPKVDAAAANALGLIGDERALGCLMESAQRLERELATLGSDGSAEAAPAVGVASGRPTEDDDPGDLPPPAVEMVWPDRTTGRKLLEQHAKPGPRRSGLPLALLALASDRQVPAAYRYFALKNLELIVPELEPPPSRSPATPGQGALSPLSGPELAREVALLLSDADASVRYAALGVIEELATPGGAEYLEGAVTDPNHYVRVRACMALAVVAPGRARKHLFALLSDSDDQVRRAARKALDELGPSG
ncbi:MAG: HEAT repeat domain-containing protein [Candidatus Riflebacteria bacterium]|nr:HEAT repeat domain-containing protein [Candidatus Riflebacteria bacterium]